MLFKKAVCDLIVTEMMKISEEIPKRDKGDEKEATRVADTLVHIASRSLSEPLNNGAGVCLRAGWHYLFV